jgi:hypothetical protein
MTSHTATIETQADGHSFLSAWTVIWAFGLAGVFLLGLAFEAALNHFFG